jgi:hypothetical protein
MLDVRKPPILSEFLPVSKPFDFPPSRVVTRAKAFHAGESKSWYLGQGSAKDVVINTQLLDGLGGDPK